MLTKAAKKREMSADKIGKWQKEGSDLSFQCHLAIKSAWLIRTILEIQEVSI